MKLQDIRIGTRLTLGFGVLLVMMLALSAFSVIRMTTIDDTVEQQKQVLVKRLEPLYIVREALVQTGMSARNTYIFTDNEHAMRELDIVDQQKAVVMKVLQELAPLYDGNKDFAKVSHGLTAMEQELNRPRKYHEAG